MKNKFVFSHKPASSKDYELIQLPNQIRLVNKQITHSKIVHCGFMLDIGTRDEAQSQAGIAHFWEHMAFKGTEKRKAFHIINRLESVGGELNAYTTKDKICFYASVMQEHFERAFELLCDIVFHSTFPVKEIEKERGVILEEMSMYNDMPEDAICDEFESLIFANHSLGKNILGHTESIQSISQKDFLKFIKQNLDTSKIVFSSVGNISINKVKSLSDKYLNHIPLQKSLNNRLKFSGYKPTVLEIQKSYSQSHSVLGRNAFASSHKKRIDLFMLINLLGGPGMNSKLNLSLREQRGLVYHVEATYTSYTDAGLIEIYFGAEKKHLDKIHQLIFQELKNLSSKALSSNQLSVYQSQLIGQLALAEESNVSLMQMMAKSILDLGTIESLEAIFKRISLISSASLLEVANILFDENKISRLTYISE